MECSGDAADKQFGVGNGYDLKGVSPAECFDHDTLMYDTTASAGQQTMTNNKETSAIEPESEGRAILTTATFDQTFFADTEESITVKGVRNIYRWTFNDEGIITKWEAAYDPVITTVLMR